MDEDRRNVLKGLGIVGAATAMAAAGVNPLEAAKKSKPKDLAAQLREEVQNLEVGHYDINGVVYKVTETDQTFQVRKMITWNGGAQAIRVETSEQTPDFNGLYLDGVKTREENRFLEFRDNGIDGTLDRIQERFLKEGKLELGQETDVSRSTDKKALQRQYVSELTSRLKLVKTF